MDGISDEGSTECRPVYAEVRGGGATTTLICKLDEVVLDGGPVQGDNNDDQDRIDSLSVPH